MVTMSAVWDRTTEFLSDNLGKVAPIAALTILLPGAVTEILAPLKEGDGAGYGLGLGILTLVAALVTVWGELQIVALAIDPTLTPADARGT